MSAIAAAQARVAEIQALIARATGAAPPAPGAASGTSFQAQLAAAQQPAGQAAAASAGGPTAYDAEIAAAAQRHGIDPALLKALIRAESNFNPNAVSPAGAQGLTQLMPATARALGVTNPFDPAQAIDAGARYLRQQLDRFGGDERLALAAYNAGPGAVQRYGGVPPYAETQAYVERVLAYAAQYRAASSAAVTAPVAAVGLAAGSPSLPYSVT
jgi:soluble lytic murein transglycosylase-like protein